MITIKELTKTYNSKLGDKCRALDGITLDLPEKGMVFLLGRSGSGKSTLLNLLGGLDSASSGEIIYKGESFIKYKSRDYDAFRNNLGFVFQDSNLIDTLTVKENLALSQELKQKKVQDEEILTALKAVDIEELGKRYVYEISGGQKQRVALARALVRNPSMILADEPTGNLDSVSGKLILDNLKELSNDRLIVIASHDREFADTYGDRIIELEDGRVIRDTSADYVSDYVNEKIDKKKKYGLKLSHCLKLVKVNLKFRPIRLIVIVILASLILATMSASLSMNDYYFEEAHIRNLVNGEYANFTLTERYSDENNYYKQEDVNLGNAFIENINTNYSALNYVKVYEQDHQKYVIYEDGIFGYTLAEGAVDLTENSVYVTDYYAQQLIDYDNSFSGKYIELNGIYKRIHSLNNIFDLQNKTLYHSYGNTYVPYFHIAGIIITPNGIFDFEHKLEYLIKTKELSNYYYEADRYVTYYVNQDYLDKNSNIPYNLYDTQHFSIDFSGTAIQYINDYVYFIYKDLIYESLIIGIDEYYCQTGYPEGEKKSIDDFILNNGEILLTVEQYNAVFNENYEWEYDYFSLYEIIEEGTGFEYPEHIGEKISITVYDDLGNKLAEAKDMTFKGIIVVDKDQLIDFQREEFVKNKPIMGCYMTEEDKEEMFADFPPFVSALVVNIDQDTEYYMNLQDYAASNDVYVFSPISDTLYDFSSKSEINTDLIVIVGLIMLVLIMGFLSLHISSGIRNRFKEIGILRAQGASNGDIIKIYLIESFFIAAFIAIIALVSVPLAIYGINSIMAQYVWADVALYRATPVIYLLVGAIPFAIVAIASLLPFIKVSRMKPIDSIRKV